MAKVTRNPAVHEWDVKKCIADYVKNNNGCSLIDIITHCNKFSLEEVKRATVQLQFIGMIEEQTEDSYIYIADRGNYYGIKRYDRKYGN